MFPELQLLKIFMQIDHYSTEL